MTQRIVLSQSLAPEEEAELSLAIRAAHDLCAAMKVATSASCFMISLLEGLVRTGLVRMKPNRRLTYLLQWRQFLCWLPDAVSLVPEAGRLPFVETAIREFRMEDQRGRSKPGPPFPEGANCLLDRDGEFWYAKVTLKDIPESVSGLPSLAELKEKFDAGEQIYESERPSIAINTERAVFLRPFNPPSVLKKEYEKLIRILPQNDLKQPLDAKSVAPDVSDIPPQLIVDWVKDGVSRTDLALLIAARRAKMTAKVSNLPHLHAALHWAR